MVSKIESNSLDSDKDKSLLKIDMHVHTTCSKHPFWGVDAMSCPKEVIKRAIKLGLDGIAVTDHNTTRGGLKIAKMVKEHGLQDKLIVITGTEIKSKNGDILAYGIEKDISPRMWGIETIERIQDESALAFVAHPFKGKFFNYYYGGKSSWLKQKRRVKFDGIESFNAAASVPANEMADKLASILKVSRTGGSDAHILSHIGHGLTYVDTSDFTMDGVIEAIRKGKTQVKGVNYTISRPLKLYFYKLVQLIRRSFGKGYNSCQLKQNPLAFNIFNLEIF
ncbi:MAG: PHP domain-containing protein [Candidatus Lokiarchaeota archaeon]|nr:PHP domain-containing protein [Candidatus Lokiarchaeota archaeon]